MMLFLVWQAQFDNNQITLQQNHIVVLVNLLNRFAGKFSLDFILYIDINLAPDTQQAGQARTERTNGLETNHVLQSSLKPN